MKKELAKLIFKLLSPYGFWKQLAATLSVVLVLLVIPLAIAYPNEEAMTAVGIVGFMGTLAVMVTIHYLYYWEEGEEKKQKETDA